MNEPKPKRRRFQFSLQTLGFFMALVSLIALRQTENQKQTALRAALGAAQARIDRLETQAQVQTIILKRTLDENQKIKNQSPGPSNPAPLPIGPSSEPVR